MTPAESRSLKSGDRVFYHDIDARVLHVRKNGITITYWGRGAREGRSIRQRVPARYLELTPCGD